MLTTNRKNCIEGSTPFVRARRRSAIRGFTLIEALVAIVLVSIGVVAVFQGIRNLGAADTKAKTAALLQELAFNKFNELSTVTDPTTVGNGGDFTDEGHPEIIWSLDLEATATNNLDKMTVTATMGQNQQSIVGLYCIPPTPTTTTGTGTAGN